jgi:hypothetical protein
LQARFFAFEVCLVFVSLVEFNAYGNAEFSCCEVAGYELASHGMLAFGGVVKMDVDAFYVFSSLMVKCVVNYQDAVFYAFGVEFFFDEFFWLCLAPRRTSRFQ